MKRKIFKSYKKIFIFESIMLLVLILNVCNTNILKLYRLPIFLLIADFLFFLILGFEKDNKRLKKEVTFEVFICTIIFLLFYYVFGIFISFAYTDDYLTIYGIEKIILPLLLTIVFKEDLRKSLLTKCGDSKFLMIYTFLIFILIDISSSLSIIKINDSYNIFLFIALTLLPSISRNIFATYISKNVGTEPIILYLIITTLYEYIIPIVPNPNRYLKSIIDFIIPIIMLVRVIKVVDKYSDKDYEIERNYNKLRVAYLIIPIFITSLVVYLVSGYFKYYAIAIASGSMKPVFDRGYVVVVEQVGAKYDNYDKLQNGEIIAFKTEKEIVVHRIIKKIETKDEVIYYTKGDANPKEDNYAIKRENIVGIVRFKVPFIGYPTIWLSEI